MVSPELMGKRQVEAHGVGGDLIAQGRELLGKSFGLLVADGSVERRNHVEQAGLAGGVGQLDQRESGSDADEVRSGVAGFQLGTNELDRIALERHFAFTCLCHGCRSRWMV